jgi:Protein of unknown function (DUF3277)
MANPNPYDPGRVIITFAGNQLSGFMTGTFITADRAEDGFSIVVGPDGLATRIQNRDQHGSVQFTCQQTSASNDILASLHQQDLLFGTGIGELQVKDLNGTILVHAESAWVKKFPKITYAKEMEGREWTIDCADLQIITTALPPPTSSTALS